MNPDRTVEGDWFAGVVPENVALDQEAYLESTYSFQLFDSRCPEAVRIGRGASVYLGTMFDVGPGGRVRVGEFTLLNGARIICDHSIEIGDYGLISWNVVIMDTWRLPRDLWQRRVALETVSRMSSRRCVGPSQGSPIVIGPNVWLGFDVCVLPGVTIGEGAVVGARSVVVEDVPAYTMAAGNPARCVRRLNPEEGRPS